MYDKKKWPGMCQATKMGCLRGPKTSQNIVFSGFVGESIPPICRVKSWRNKYSFNHVQCGMPLQCYLIGFGPPSLSRSQDLNVQSAIGGRGYCFYQLSADGATRNTAFV